MAAPIGHACDRSNRHHLTNAGETIRDGDRVVLKKENIIQIGQVKKGKKVNMDKQWFHLNGAVGFPYGTTFMAEGNNIRPVEEDTDIQNIKGEDKEELRDNRDIRDTSDSQKLSREEIEELKREGETGEGVIKHLIENSSTFNKKTEYAQAKYIKKKAKKHINKFTIVKPTTRLIAEMYFNRGATRINYLRMDSLAQMLTYGDVKANNRQLIVESCNGLVLAATIERMAGHGTLVQLHAEQDPPRQALEGYNFSDKHYSILHDFPLKLMGTVQLEKTDSGTEKRESPDSPVLYKKARLDDTIGAAEETNGSETVMEVESTDQSGETEENQEIEARDEAQEDGATKATEVEHSADAEEQPQKKVLDKSKQMSKEEQEQRKKQKSQKNEETRQILLEGNFDSLLIATRVHPTPIVLRLLELLADSRPVAVFSPYQEPLMDCYQRLRDSGKVVHLRLSETWLRNFQVLPNRTHPEINMSMNGGFLLTFIKVSEKPAPEFSC